MSIRALFFVFNFLGLQITWAACAYGATHSQPNLGLLIAVFYIVLHMFFSKSRKQDLLTLLCVGLIGIFLDHINTYLGLVSFNDSNVTHSVIPLWLISLWLVFSLTLPYILGWLEKKPWLAFFLGGAGGSSSYWLAHKLGAIILYEPLAISTSIYFLQWAIFLPIAYRILDIIRKKLA